MRKNKEARKKESKRRRLKKLSLESKYEKETHRLQKEVEAVQNSINQIIKPTSDSELRRQAKSLLPKEKKVIKDIRAYRKQRKKRLNNE